MLRSFNYNFSVSTKPYEGVGADLYMTVKREFLAGSIFNRFGCVQLPRKRSCEVLMEHLSIGMT